MLFRKRHMFRRPIIIRSGRYKFPGKLASGIITAASVVILFAVIVKLISALEPVMTQMATAGAKNIVTTAINEAVSEHISDGSLSYNGLINLEKKDNGEITAITTNVASVNTLRAEITNDVIEKVSDMSSDLSIPLGNILGINILGGRGPGIPFKVVALSSTSADFADEFISAGINQTKHQIMLEITVDINILMPGSSATALVNTEVLVAETVIVGNVPDSYLNLEGLTG